MKTTKLFLTAFLALFTSFSFAQNGISGSAHDFSAAGWGTTEICQACHTPHGADATVAESPLWNHQVTAASFTPYASTTLDATVGQPGGSSKLCLSCHDGTVALDNFGGTTVGTNFIGDPIGPDLTTEHPISFNYDAALATLDGGLHDPTVILSGLAGGGTITADLLFAGSLECASCHDVHNADNIAFLLRKANTASALCLTCHNK